MQAKSALDKPFFEVLAPEYVERLQGLLDELHASKKDSIEKQICITSATRPSPFTAI